MVAHVRVTGLAPTAVNTVSSVSSVQLPASGATSRRYFIISGVHGSRGTSHVRALPNGRASVSFCTPNELRAGSALDVAIPRHLYSTRVVILPVPQAVSQSPQGSSPGVDGQRKNSVSATSGFADVSNHATTNLLVPAPSQSSPSHSKAPQTFVQAVASDASDRDVVKAPVAANVIAPRSPNVDSRTRAEAAVESTAARKTTGKGTAVVTKAPDVKVNKKKVHACLRHMLWAGFKHRAVRRDEVHLFIDHMVANFGKAIDSQTGSAGVEATKPVPQGPVRSGDVNSANTKLAQQSERNGLVDSLKMSQAQPSAKKARVHSPKRSGGSSKSGSLPKLSLAGSVGEHPTLPQKHAGSPKHLAYISRIILSKAVLQGEDINKLMKTLQKMNDFKSRRQVIRDLYMIVGDKGSAFYKLSDGNLAIITLMLEISVFYPFAQTFSQVLASRGQRSSEYSAALESFVRLFRMLANLPYGDVEKLSSKSQSEIYSLGSSSYYKDEVKKASLFTGMVKECVRSSCQQFKVTKEVYFNRLKANMRKFLSGYFSFVKKYVLGEGYQSESPNLDAVTPRKRGSGAINAADDSSTAQKIPQKRPRVQNGQLSETNRPDPVKNASQKEGVQAREAGEQKGSQATVGNQEIRASNVTAVKHQSTGNRSPKSASQTAAGSLPSLLETQQRQDHSERSGAKTHGRASSGQHRAPQSVQSVYGALLGDAKWNKDAVPKRSIYNKTVKDYIPRDEVSAYSDIIPSPKSTAFDRKPITLEDGTKAVEYELGSFDAPSLTAIPIRRESARRRNVDFTKGQRTGTISESEREVQNRSSLVPYWYWPPILEPPHPQQQLEEKTVERNILLAYEDILAGNVDYAIAWNSLEAREIVKRNIRDEMMARLGVTSPRSMLLLFMHLIHGMRKRLCPEETEKSFFLHGLPRNMREKLSRGRFQG